VTAHHFHLHAGEANILDYLHRREQADALGKLDLVIGHVEHDACAVANQTASGLQGIIRREGGAGQRLPFAKGVQQSAQVVPAYNVGLRGATPADANPCAPRRVSKNRADSPACDVSLS